MDDKYKMSIINPVYCNTRIMRYHSQWLCSNQTKQQQSIQILLSKQYTTISPNKHSYSRWIHSTPTSTHSPIIFNDELNHNSDSLLELINNESLIYISTDSAREDTKSGGGWLIVTDTGQRIVHGFNPDYGQSEDIHSYRSEVYASLAALLFLHFYAAFFNTIITNNIIGICDNEAYVNKLNEIIVNPRYLKYLYKTTEHEAFKLIFTIIPNNFKLLHINSHQDDECSYNELPLTAKLNVQADTIATNNARKPINTHLLTSPFAIYVANKYIPYNIDNKIRETSHSKLAKQFLQTKYKWSTQTINQINWEAHSNCIRKLSHSKKYLYDDSFIIAFQQARCNS